MKTFAAGDKEIHDKLVFSLSLRSIVICLFLPLLLLQTLEGAAPDSIAGLTYDELYNKYPSRVERTTHGHFTADGRYEELWTRIGSVLSPLAPWIIANYAVP